MASHHALRNEIPIAVVIAIETWDEVRSIMKTLVNEHLK